MKVLTIALLLTVACTATAQSATISKALLENELFMACPDAQYLSVNNNGVTFLSEPSKKGKVVVCLKEAMLHIDPYPVSPGKARPATTVQLDGGIIKLR